MRTLDQNTNILLTGASRHRGAPLYTEATQEKVVTIIFTLVNRSNRSQNKKAWIREWNEIKALKCLIKSAVDAWPGLVTYLQLCVWCRWRSIDAWWPGPGWCHQWPSISRVSIVLSLHMCQPIRGRAEASATNQRPWYRDPDQLQRIHHTRTAGDSLPNYFKMSPDIDSKWILQLDI